MLGSSSFYSILALQAFGVSPGFFCFARVSKRKSRETMVAGEPVSNKLVMGHPST